MFTNLPKAFLVNNPFEKSKFMMYKIMYKQTTGEQNGPYFTEH